MSYLLDTNVVSELRHVRPHGGVLAWLEAVPENALYMSAVTIGEIQAGIEITRRQDAARAVEIEAWLDQVSQAFNVLPVDAAAFRCWAKLMDRRADHHIEDALIAATAMVNDLVVVTRNVRDFEPFGVRTLDPFKA
ncbi:hypothetical protein SAMN02983003_1365 [Devosia enhydra]|uniref:PIN domain-containing protein n=1 Tax=Devosia enhydra TaxID=665118 RepID=A0A1K2HVU6_9HYPH|nr:type II toxin-antitoxin system VapC family toxin [Devosia enhydra]SFZ82943.1 hypothetical protein SAMN02983003_1365 [Devosia enhydra]